MHDFKNFPELTNSQFEMYYFSSPHKQIVRDFRAKVINVHDADTVTLRWTERNFDFPIRFLDINAPELSEERGNEARDWLKRRIEGNEVDIKMNRENRVDKWGRLLGDVHFNGISCGEEMLRNRIVTKFDQRKEGKIPSPNEVIPKWF